MKCNCNCDCDGSEPVKPDICEGTNMQDCPTGFSANSTIKNSTNVPVTLRPNVPFTIGGQSASTHTIKPGETFTYNFPNHTSVELDWGTPPNSLYTGSLAISNGGGVSVAPGGNYISGDPNNSLQATGSVVAPGITAESFNNFDGGDKTHMWQSSPAMRSCNYTINVEFTGKLPAAYTQGTRVVNNTGLDIKAKGPNDPTSIIISNGASKTWDGSSSITTSFYDPNMMINAGMLSVSYQEGVILTVTADSGYNYSVTVTPKGGDPVTATLNAVGAKTIVSGSQFQSGGDVTLTISKASDSQVSNFC